MFNFSNLYYTSWGGLTNPPSPYRLQDKLWLSTKAETIVSILFLVVIMACVMSMAMQMGMSHPYLIRAVVHPGKSR